MKLEFEITERLLHRIGIVTTAALICPIFFGIFGLFIGVDGEPNFWIPFAICLAVEAASVVIFTAVIAFAKWIHYGWDI